MRNTNLFNNAVANNNSDNNGGITMTDINSMDSFVKVVLGAMKVRFGEGYKVDVNKVMKNNGLELTGLCIRDESVNLAPTIYLEQFYNQYNEGRGLEDILENIVYIYESHKVTYDFDVSSIMDFDRVQDKICCKLISASRNAELLKNAPYVTVEDMVIVFFVLLGHDVDGTATITIKNDLFNSWGITVDELYNIALSNTESRLRGTVRSMSSVLTEIMAIEMDEATATEFFDLFISEDDVPMYIATNESKQYGATVIVYRDLLKEVANKLNSDLYILPSSVHETILVPASIGMNVDELKDMVMCVNSTEVAEEEVLSDSVYYYDRALDIFQLA